MKNLPLHSKFQFIPRFFFFFQYIEVQLTNNYNIFVVFLPSYGLNMLPLPWIQGDTKR